MNFIDVNKTSGAGASDVWLIFSTKLCYVDTFDRCDLGCVPFVGDKTHDLLFSRGIFFNLHL